MHVRWYLSGTHHVFEGRVLAVLRAKNVGVGRLIITDEEGSEAEIAYSNPPPKTIF